MSEISYSRTRPGARSARGNASPGDDYDEPQNSQVEYTQYDDDEDDGYEDDGYYDDEDVAVVSVNRNRAIALSATIVLVIGIFGVVLWMLMNQNPVGPGGQQTVGEVPTISGLNPATMSEQQTPSKGGFAPDFMWQEGGQTVSLSSYRGDKPVFVNFWGTWCPPCKAEMPEMQNLYNAHKNDIEIIGISMAPRDWPQQVLRFVNNSPYSWKFVHDGDYSIAQRYGVMSIPSSYFIDKNGVIQAVHVGAMTGSMMQGYLDQVK
jgi:thiol-disulfide isomerase/thioredoxin